MSCVKNQASEIRECGATDCPTHAFRTGKKPQGKSSFRAKCLDCSGQQPSQVANCTFSDCELYPYRMGKSLTRSGKPATPAQLESLRKARLILKNTVSSADSNALPLDASISAFGENNPLENSVLHEAAA